MNYLLPDVKKLSINQSNNSNSLTLIRDLSVMLNVKKATKYINKTIKNRKEQKSTNKQTYKQVNTSFIRIYVYFSDNSQIHTNHT